MCVVTPYCMCVLTPYCMCVFTPYIIHDTLRRATHTLRVTPSSRHATRTATHSATHTATHTTTPPSPRALVLLAQVCVECQKVLCICVFSHPMSYTTPTDVWHTPYCMWVLTPYIIHDTRRHVTHTLRATSSSPHTLCLPAQVCVGCQKVLCMCVCFHTPENQMYVCVFTP